MLTLLIALTPISLGYETAETETGLPVAWAKMPVSYAIQLDNAPDILTPDQWVEVIDAAINTWTQVPDTDVSFTPLEHLAGQGEPDHSLGNTIWFDNNWEGDEGVGARATLRVDAQGAPSGFDIRINTLMDWNYWGLGADPQAAMTHEAGHALGLGHSLIPEATMFAEMRPDDVFRRQLHQDDEAGVVFLYPHITTTVPPFLGCSFTGSSPFTPATLVLGALALTRRRESNV